MFHNQYNIFMNLKNSKNFLIATSAILLSLTVILGVKYYDKNIKYKKLEERYLLNKSIHQNNLKEILYRYDAEVLKNNAPITTKKSSNYTTTKTIVPTTKKSDIEKKVLLKTTNIDSLKEIIYKKNQENKSLENQVFFLISKNKELQKENTLNSTIITNSKNLTAVNILANGIKMNTHDVIKTNRFKNTNQIQICFTLLENKAAIKGNKDFYIQIINPQGNVVNTTNKNERAKNKLLDYSAKTIVYYNNEELDVCLFVTPNKEDIVKGDYEIKIYSGIHLIGSTIFALK